MTECFCGDCRWCRKAVLGELEKPKVVAPEKLHPFAEEVLRGEHFVKPQVSAPKPKPAPRRRNANGNVIHHRPGRTPVYTPEEAKQRRKENKQRSREKRLKERIEVDGRLIHPRATHGTIQGGRYYECYCKPCNDVMKVHSKERMKNARDLAGKS